MNVTQDMLLGALADGRFHSGVELGARWGISRTAVSQLVKKFALPGLKIYRVKGKGYRLSDTLYLLDEQAIIRHIPASYLSRIADLNVFKVISLTNAYLLEFAEQTPQLADDRYRICLSEMQTAGRGSRGRRWVSPPGHNIYLSMLKAFDVAPPELGGLSIVVGLALIQVLKQFGVKDVGFKWPNDIYVNARKAAGILLETRSQAFGATNVVIGIGINIRVEYSAMSEVDQPWSSIAEYGFDVSRRNEFAGYLLQNLIQFIEEFRGSGLTHYTQELTQFDLLRGKAVQLSYGKEKFSGVEVCIDSSGKLVILTEIGLQAFSSGEVTLRREIVS